MSLPEIKPWFMVIGKSGLQSFNKTGRSMFSSNAPVEEDMIVIVMDVEDLGGAVEACAWADLTVPKLLETWKEAIIVAALGRAGEDLTELSKKVRVIVQKPEKSDFDSWFKQLQSALIAIRYPDYEDKLDPAETQGGVSPEEFDETLRRAAEGD